MKRNRSDNHPGGFTRIYRNIYTTVSARTGEVYTLAMVDDHTATCTCLGWKSHQKVDANDIGECKHSRELVAEYEFDGSGSPAPLFDSPEFVERLFDNL